MVERPLDYDREDEFSVKPGLVRPEHGEHEVVWWDPSKLKLNVEGGLGFRQKEILAEDGGASLAAYREWQATQSSGAIENGLPSGTSGFHREPGGRRAAGRWSYRSKS